jgi:hypothetical protein
LKRRAALGALCAGVLMHSWVYGCILQRTHFVAGFSQVPFRITLEERARYAALKQIISLIPQSASVAATDPESPHVSNRLTTYTLNLDAGDADYLLIRPAALSSEARAHAQKALDRNIYGLVAKQGEFYLLKRGHRSPQTAQALGELGLKANPS